MVEIYIQVILLIKMKKILTEMWSMKTRFLVFMHYFLMLYETFFFQ